MNVAHPKKEFNWCESPFVSLRAATAVRASSFTLTFCCCAATTAIFHLNKILD